jgi:WD40 repeat protein
MTPLAFSPDNFLMAVTSDTRVIELVAAATGEVLANLEAPNCGTLSYLRFSPDGTRLYALQWDQQVQVWDLRRLREELRKLNLDWNAPPIPAEPAGRKPDLKPLRISIAETVSPQP